MANVTFDIMWREAMMELLDQLEAENPENPALAPKELSEWACVYIRYLQVFTKLEAAYDQMLQPQKRQDMRRALEACMGRMLEIRHWMVKLNRGLDCVQLDDLLVDLKLTPDVLEVPVPRYFVEDRAQELNDRDRFLQVLLEKFQQASAAAAAVALQPSSSSPDGQQQQPGSVPPPGPSITIGDQGLAVNAVQSGPPLLLEEAVAVIIRNERGRQARERARAVGAAKRSRLLAAQRLATGLPVSREDAARVIQAGIRGALWRRRVRREADQELVFIGMKPQPVDPQADPQALEARHLLARKQRLLDPETGSLRKYEDAIVSLKAKVKEAEGEDMREAIQDKINAWFITNRNPQTGEYPDLPAAEAGGSKAILNPPLPTIQQLLDANAAAAAAAGGSKGKGRGPKAASGAPQQQQQQQQGRLASSSAKLSSSGKQAGGRGGKAGDAAGGGNGAAACCEVASSAFIPLLEGAVAEFIAKWQDRPTPRGTAAQIAHDPELLKDELRPLVFEEVRQQVDDEMRCLLSNLKAMVAAEAAAKLGKPVGKKKKGGAVKKKEGGGGAKAAKAKGGEGKAGGKKKGSKKSKDPTADRSMESLFAQLAANRVLGTLPRAELADYLGGGGFMGATLEKAGLVPDPSMAQVRQAVAEFGILPLGSQVVHERLPQIKSLLLYGAHHTGKTMLAHAIGHLSGACFFDLSPRTTDGTYPGKAAAMLLHLVFKVAKTMAPSVVYIDEVEKVFVSDKKRAREFGGQEPFSRIRKDLVREVKALKPGDRVLVVGCSAEPWLVPRKDEAGFMGFWGKMLHVPLPDYAARRLMWPGLFARHGGRLSYDFDLSTLAHLSEGYAGGDLDAVVAGLLTPARRERLKLQPVDIPEVLQWLCRVKPVPQDVDAALHAWADETPALAAIKGAGGSSGSGGAGGKGRGSSKKGKGDSGTGSSSSSSSKAKKK